jgi:hypothetical protein
MRFVYFMAGVGLVLWLRRKRGDGPWPLFI